MPHIDRFQLAEIIYKRKGWNRIVERLLLPKDNKEANDWKRRSKKDSNDRYICFK